MPEGRVVRVLTIAVWVGVACVVAGLMFVRSAMPTLAPTYPAGARPIMYEFSSDT